MPGGGGGMQIGRRSRWKFSFGQHRSSSSSSDASSSSSSSDAVVASRPPPASFICPISSSLMYDPVIVIPTGQTFERACIQQLSSSDFIPPIAIPPPPDSSFFYNNNSNNNGLVVVVSNNNNSPPPPNSPLFLVPNSALRAAIIDWCDTHGVPHPSPIPLESARLLAHNFSPNSIISSFPQSHQLQDEQGEKDHHFPTHKTLDNHHTTTTKEKQLQSSSSSSASSEIAADHLTVSSSSSTSSSLDDTTTIPKKAAAEPRKSSNSMMMMRKSMDPLEEEIVMKLKSPQISVRESGVIALRRSTRDTPGCRTSLCTPRMLAALLPMIPPSPTTSSPALRINATAALVNLSIDPPANKIRIVRSGAVPPLVQALSPSTCSSTTIITEGKEEEEEEARYNAAGALFSLSLEDGNKLAIGVLGAIPPLVHLFCQPSARQAARLEAGMALYHLSLAPNNLSKIAKTPGAVKAILSIAQGKGNGNEEGQNCAEEEDEKISILLRLQRVALMVLASLARRNEGRAALMDADAVKAMVQMMEDGSSMGASGSSNTVVASSGKEEEYCLGVLYEMSRGSLRFRALARSAGAERVLISAVTGGSEASHQEASGTGGEVAKEMARRILKVIRGDHEERRMSAAVMLLRNKKSATEDNDDDDEEEIGSVVSDGLVSFRRRHNDDFGGGSTSNSANF